MGLLERTDLYRRLEGLRGRPVVAYVTSSRPGAPSQMAADAVAELLAQLQALPRGTDSVDLLIVSNGGDPTVAWRIVSLFREKVRKLAVLVPQAAFSAATLVALGADEIVMHPHGNLGPVDLQISVERKKGNGPAERIGFGVEDLAAFLSFSKEKVGLTDQEQLAKTFMLFCEEVGTVPIGIASRGAQLSVSMGEKLLLMHMQDSKEDARRIAEALNRNFFHHGYPVSRTEAKAIGLKVAEPQEDIESLMWEIWLDLESEMNIREPFNPMTLLRQDKACAALFAPVQQFNIPPGAPPQILQQVLNQVMQQAIVSVPPTRFSNLQAVSESLRHASRFTSDGLVLASRLPDHKIQVNVIVERASWRDLPVVSTGGSGDASPTGNA